MIIPKALQKGDEIRVIAPSRSLRIISEENRKLAEEKLSELGLTLSFGKHVLECDDFLTSSVESRVEDLHEAFSDTHVKGILTVLGGYSTNQMLSKIDYDLIAQNPKILCGFSDITALQNAIWAKSKLLTYSGPHYSTFAMKKGFEYTFENFVSCVFSKEPFEINPSAAWSSDADWYLDQENRTFEKNNGYRILSEGSAEGTIIGGNLGTFTLLKGTAYMPSLENTILFLEEDSETGGSDVEFDRHLQSLIDLPDFSGVQALVIGRFEKASNILFERFKKIIQSKPELRGMPIIAEADFGHTTPLLTFPVGGTASMEVADGQVSLRILEH